MLSAIFITARMKSVRLPRKVTKPICGIPMIIHLINRLKLSKTCPQIIMCTSANPDDQILADIAEQKGIACFRGSEDDVLERLSGAAKKYNVEQIISCTADNPFVDPIYIDMLFNYHLAQKNDYTKVNGLPWGVFSYAISQSALIKACKIKAETNTEVWGGYFTQSGIFKCGVFQVEDEFFRKPNIRLTVDTPEDFKLICEIFKRLYIQGKVFSLREILELLKKEPQLLDINKNIRQKQAIPVRLKDNPN